MELADPKLKLKWEWERLIFQFFNPAIFLYLYTIRVRNIRVDP